MNNTCYKIRPIKLNIIQYIYIYLEKKKKFMQFFTISINNSCFGLLKIKTILILIASVKHL